MVRVSEISGGAVRDDGGASSFGPKRRALTAKRTNPRDLMAKVDSESATADQRVRVRAFCRKPLRRKALGRFRIGAHCGEAGL